MKRLSALFLSLMMLLSMTACGSDTVSDAVIDVMADVVIDAIEDGQEESPAASTQPDKFLYLPEATEDHISVVVPDDSQDSFTPPVEEGEYYYDLENVVLYIEYYGELPENYITKNEARALGWEGGTPEQFLEGSAIGGDTFGNREGLLPKESGRTYTECDLNTDGASGRGAERLVFSNDGLYFHTEDHYGHFTQYTVTEDWEVVEW